MKLSIECVSTDSLSNIRIPVLVLAGSDDIIKLSHTKLIAKKLPNAQLRILSGEDHGSYIIQPYKIGAWISREVINCAMSSAIPI